MITMKRKLCPECGAYTYTAHVEADWSCTKCGHDITDQPSLEIEPFSSSPKTDGHKSED